VSTISSGDPKPVVLVVEDEPVVRMMAADMIEDAGFDVIEAANAAEAVAILEARSDIRIIFSDIEMPPGIDGIKLAALVRHRWPPIEIILVSGRMLERDVQLPARAQFFKKPFQTAEIIAAMRRLTA
jgi:CheY-like chemotaxis protein